MKTTGVYKIQNRTTGKFYVGSSSTSIQRRWNHHKVHLRRGTHDSKYMQNAWKKYGGDDFDFTVLVICAPEHCLLYEQICIDTLRPQYNTCKIAGSNRGIKHTDETKLKFSAAQRKWRKKYEWKGQMLCLSDIAEIEGIDKSSIISRANGMGFTVEQAVSQPKRVGKWVIEHEGKSQDLYQWAEELGVHPKRIQSRLVKGVPFADIVNYLNASFKKMSFSEFCKHAGISHTTAKSRVKMGWSLMEAITVPIKPIGNHCRRLAA